MTVLALLAIALVQTSLSEELFFRGFLGKRLIKLLGFGVGNTLQAVAFGGVHLLGLRKLTDPAMLTVGLAFFIPAFFGWLLGYLKEKHANGSIIPGWIAHGVGNALSFVYLAFVM